MDSLLKQYDLIVRNKSQKAESFRVKESMFKEEITDEIMDIAHSEAEKMMKNEEDILFLVMQREHPKSCTMGSADMSLHHKEMRKRKRIEKIMKQEVISKKEQGNFERTVILESSSSSGTESECDDPTVSHTPSRGVMKKRSRNLITENVSSTYDRLNISNRDAAMSYAVTAKALGHNLEELSISSSTMYRTRRNHRKAIAEMYKSEEFCSGHSLVLHWDSKILPDIKDGRESVERIAVLVSADGKEKLLGIPKVMSGTGENIARVCMDLVKEHGMEERVKGLSFDTTASNTGVHAGACVLIEKSFNRELLYFPCRNHIYEVVLSHVFKFSYGPSSGPDIPVFKRFQAQWKSIDRSKIEPHDFSQASDVIKELKRKSVFLVRRIVSTTHQRDDYKELLQLVLLFLGEATVEEFSLRSPGAFHHARWMAKGIYSLKLILTKNQLKMSSHELKALTDISLFVALVYIRGWSRACLSSKAASVDMEFMRDTDDFARSGYTVGKVARDAMARHLWYISETLIAMAFFDEDVSEEEKAQMVISLEKPALKKAVKRPEGKCIGNFSSKHFADFVTKNTITFFETLNLDKDFLKKPVREWPELEGFKNAATSVNKISVVNDSAERAIALMKEFNSSLTKDEKQKQQLLKTVMENRLMYPKKTKDEYLRN